jgi:hypothetical protein
VENAMNAQIASTTKSQHVVARGAKADSRFSRNYPGLLASVGFVAVLSLAQSDAALAATAPGLGSDSTYAIVSSTYTNSLNAGTETKIIGLGSLSPTVCYNTGPSTPPISILGAITTPCPNINVGLDFNTALANLNAQALLPSCTNLGVGAVNLDAVNLGGGPGVFPPGCYKNGGAMGIVANGIVTLNGPGVYIFKPNGALTTGANSLVTLANGACASDVFWAPTATTLGANAATSPTPTFVGNILDPAGITLGHFTNLTGRALAFGVTVTTDSNTVTVPTCAPFGGGGAGIPTLSEWAMVMLAAFLAIAGFAVMRRKAR